MDDMTHGAPPDHRLERLSFFSDAVFAIAITLLVIELHVPHVEVASDRAFLIALLQIIPKFIGFAVSFFVIGAFWAGHHRAFECAAHWDSCVVGPNLLLLFTVAAMPFFTAFSSEYGNQRVPVAAYAVWLTLTGLANLRLQRVLMSAPIVAEGVTPAHIAQLRRRGWAVVLGGGSAFVMALLFPPLSLGTLISIPFWRRLLDRLA